MTLTTREMIAVFDPQLQIGASLTNDELRRLFKCSPYGGMRRSKRTGTLVIVDGGPSSSTPYKDRRGEDVLYYTGMGQRGDQSLDARQNKTLNESATNGVDVHLFEYEGTDSYTYMGQVELAGTPTEESQPDADGVARRVIIFPLRAKPTV